MNRITISIHIDLPDGIVPDVEYGEAPRYDADEVIQEPPHLLEAPFPDVPAAITVAPVCPQGHGPMKYVPAGTSKRTGKPYEAFWGCQNRDCKQTAKAAA